MTAISYLSQFSVHMHKMIKINPRSDTLYESLHRDYPCFQKGGQPRRGTVAEESRSGWWLLHSIRYLDVFDETLSEASRLIQGQLLAWLIMRSNSAHTSSS